MPSYGGLVESRRSKCTLLKSACKLNAENKLVLGFKVVHSHRFWYVTIFYCTLGASVTPEKLVSSVCYLQPFSR